MKIEVHSTSLPVHDTCPFQCYLAILCTTNTIFPEMDMRWVVSVLVVVGLVMVETAQALNVSKICLQDTSAFLWEVNQTKPRKYAALSKYTYFPRLMHRLSG